MIIDARDCHPECPWCARDFWRWYAARARNPLAVAAVTSIRADDVSRFRPSVSRWLPDGPAED